MPGEHAEANAVERSASALLAWVLCALTLTTVAGTTVLAFLNRGSLRTLEDANPVEIVLPIGFALVGGLIASRLPRNAMGWMLLAISLATAITGVSSQYTRFALLTEPASPFTPWIPWLGNLTNSLVYPAGLATIALLLMPNGHFASPRWRLVAVFSGSLALVSAVITLIDPSTVSLEGLPPLTNPTGNPLGSGLIYGPVGAALFFGGLAAILLAGASIVLRMRSADRDERLQLRWIAYATALSVIANIVTALLGLAFGWQSGLGGLATVTTLLGFGIALPASFAVAILRYRLYDLDLLVNRTVVYGAVTVVLAAAFGVADITAQRMVESAFEQRSDLISGALGVGAAVAFGPMRRWARPVVDRFLPARGRLALLFTDIVGSTQAIVDLGDERWRDVLNRYRATVRQELSRFHGREVNTAGDAFFATFDRPQAAVDCARAVRASVKRLGLGVRTGLHIGDVEMRGEQVSGLAVHAAARVMAEAGEDEILLSGDLAEELSHNETALRDAGTHELRGVPGSWHLYAVDA